MTPRVPEDGEEKVRAAIDDARLLPEVRRAVHHAEQLDDAADTVERAERVLRGGEQIEPDIPRRFLGLLDCDLRADLPFGEV